MNTGFENLSTVDRVSRLIFGYVLIGVAYFHEGTLGLLSLLPLIAIYPMTTAAIGFCPVEAAIKKFWAGATRQSSTIDVHSGHARGV